MSKSNTNPLIKLVKQSVGLPAGSSGCCGPAAATQPEPAPCCEAAVKAAPTPCCQPASVESESQPAGCC